MESKAAVGIENTIQYDPHQQKVSRKRRVTPRQDSKSDRTGDLATPQGPTFVEATTPYAKPAAQINIIQLPDAIIEALKALDGVSPKPNLLPSGQRDQAPQVLLHELSPKIVHVLLQIPCFRNAVANVIRYVTLQAQIPARETSPSFIGDFDPTDEDISTQLAAFIVLTSGIPYDQTDVLLSKSNSGEVPLGFSLDQDVMEVDSPAAQTPGS